MSVAIRARDWTRRATIGLAVVVAVAATGSLAHAAGGGDHGGSHGFDAKTFALQLLNFGVLAFLLIKFGGRALRRALEARHDRMKADLDEAARLRAEAERRSQEHERRLAGIEKEVEAMRADFRREVEAERKRIVESAEEKARRIQKDVQFQLDQQIKEAEGRLRAEIAAAAARMAETLLRGTVGPDDEQRLLRAFVDEVTAAPGRPPARGPGSTGGATQASSSGMVM